MGQIEQAQIKKIADMNWLISSLYELSVDATCYGPETVQHIAELASIELRRAHPIDYSLPDTACDNQMSLQEIETS